MTEHLHQAAGKRPTLDAVSLAIGGKIKGSEGNKNIFLLILLIPQDSRPC